MKHDMRNNSLIVEQLVKEAKVFYDDLLRSFLPFIWANELLIHRVGSKYCVIPLDYENIEDDFIFQVNFICDNFGISLMYTGKEHNLLIAIYFDNDTSHYVTINEILNLYNIPDFKNYHYTLLYTPEKLSVAFSLINAAYKEYPICMKCFK